MHLHVLLISHHVLNLFAASIRNLVCIHQIFVGLLEPSRTRGRKRSCSRRRTRGCRRRRRAAAAADDASLHLQRGIGAALQELGATCCRETRQDPTTHFAQLRLQDSRCAKDEKLRASNHFQLRLRLGIGGKLQRTTTTTTTTTTTSRFCRQKGPKTTPVDQQRHQEVLLWINSFCIGSININSNNYRVAA